MPATPATISVLDSAAAAWLYEGTAARLVRALKYRSHRCLMPWAAASLARARPPHARPDVITWVPASPSGRRDRGFDQGAVLARSLGRLLDRPVRPLVARRGGDRRQTGGGRAQRHRGPGLAIAARHRSTIARCAPSVLVVDDVITTGASIQETAATLVHAGAGEVHALALARADRTLAASR